MPIWIALVIFSQVLDDFQVNDEDYACDAPQLYPNVAGSDSAGAVIWYDLRPPAHGAAVYASRLDDNGDTIGINFRISDDTLQGCYGLPSIATDHEGNFTVVWIQPVNTVVRGRRYSRNGVPLGPSFAINEFSGYCNPPSIAKDSSGRAIVVWSDDHAGSRRVYGQLYQPDGSSLGGNFPVSDTMTANPVYTDVCWNNEDRITVIWTSNNRIRGQFIDSAGNMIGSSFFINEDSLITGESFPAVKSDRVGNFLVTWSGNDQGQNVYARLFDTTAAPLTGAIQLDGPQRDSSNRTDVALKDSVWFIAFQDGLSGGVYLQRLDNHGQLIGGNLRISDPIGKRNYLPKICSLGNNYIVVWDRWIYNMTYDIMGQLITPDGSLAGYNYVISDDKGGAAQYLGALAADTSGNFFIVWDDFRRIDSVDYHGNQYGKMLHPDGQPFTRDTLISHLPGGAYSAIAVNDLGLYVSIWSLINAPDSLRQVYGQRFDRNGVFLGSNFLVSVDTQNNVLGINRIYALQNNDFIVFWNVIQTGSGYYRIHGRFLDPLGIPYGNEFALCLDSAADNRSNCLIDMGNNRIIMCIARMSDAIGATIQGYDYSANPITAPVVLNDSPASMENFSGARGLQTCLFAWAVEHAVTGQLIDHGLNKIGSNFRISDDTATTNNYPRVISNAHGMYLVIWQHDHLNDCDIYGQFFDSLGVRIGNNIRIDNDTSGAQQWIPDAYSRNNKIYLTWSDTRIPSHWYDVYCKVMEWPDLPYTPENEAQNCQVMLSVNPNPFRSIINIGLGYSAKNRGKAQNLQLRIFDTTGRLIRSFVLPTAYSLLPTVVWDGTDQTGRMVPAGVYFIVLSAGEQNRVQKIIKIQ